MLTFRSGKRGQMSKSRFPYLVLAAMLLAEFAVQGAETTRGAKEQMNGAVKENPAAHEAAGTPSDCRLIRSLSLHIRDRTDSRVGLCIPGERFRERNRGV